MATKADEVRIVRLEERTQIVFWALGIFIAAGVALLVAGGRELYLLNGRVSGMDSDVRYLRSSIDALHLKQSAASPTDPSSIEAAKSVLITAQSQNIKIDQNIIKTTGIKFIEAAAKNPHVWPVAEQYLSYRSFLNADSLPPVTPATGTSKYRSQVTMLINPEHPEMHLAYQVQFAGGYAQGDKAARLERLDNPQPEGSEFGFFIIVGVANTIVLDGEYMKNVIIRHADVAYDGGSVVLENVYFVNCTFRSFRQSQPGIDLGKTILASASATFSSKASAGAPGSR
jgi:hypothetical protein